MQTLNMINYLKKSINEALLDNVTTLQKQPSSEGVVSTPVREYISLIWENNNLIDNIVALHNSREYLCNVTATLGKLE